MKEYLEKIINAKTEEVENIREKVKTSDSADEVRSLGETLEKVLGELNEAKEQLSKLDEPADEPADEEPRADDEEDKPTDEEPKDEEEPRAEDDEEDKPVDEEDPTRSANWEKVDASNLKKVASFEERGGNKMNEELLKELETRGKALMEGRAVTVASSDILLPQHQSSDLATAPFKQVSSFVDLTKVRNLQGGESYEAPFVKTYGVAGTTEEGADYTDAEPTFGTAKINKVKITAYAEISEELEKLPAANYEAEVRKGVEIALKKKMAQQQINGAGTSNNFIGITSTVADNTAVLVEDDLTIATIDQDTLNEIIFSYGGDEEVEQQGVLLLNKADLLAFSKVRNEIGDHAYKIDIANQTINTVPYIINSNCAALSKSETATDAYTMIYGIPQHYETAIFSPVEVMKSYDYKFKQGMIAYKASVFAGGNTTSYRGFMRIKKGTPSA